MLLRQDVAEMPTINMAIDCSKRPYDVRPFVRNIMKAQNWILKRLPENVPLVIVVGEVHNFPSHIAAQQMLLHSLQRQQRKLHERTFIFGWEHPHNYRAQTNERFNLNLPRDHIEADDPDGKLTLETFIDAPDHILSPFSKKTLARFCLKNKISCSFNDLAQLQKGSEILIDQNDPPSHEIVKKYAPDHLGINVFRTSNLNDDALGIHLSNHAIVDNARAHQKRSQSRIIVQQCGIYHLEELSDLFREAGYTVLSVACCSEDLDSKKGHQIMAHGLNEHDFRDFSEKALLRRLNRNSGRIVGYNF